MTSIRALDNTSTRSAINNNELTVDQCVEATILPLATFDELDTLFNKAVDNADNPHSVHTEMLSLFLDKHQRDKMINTDLVKRLSKKVSDYLTASEFSIEFDYE